MKIQVFINTTNQTNKQNFEIQRILCFILFYFSTIILPVFMRSKNGSVSRVHPSTRQQ